MNSIEALKSVAVLGQLQTGKKTICRLLGERYSAQRREPLRYRMALDNYPRLNGYVLTIYSKLESLNLEMPERAGMIVVTPEKMTSLCQKQRFRRHPQFFEMLEKLCWLGVNRYLVLVNRMNDPNQEQIDWFSDASQEFSHILEEHYSLSNLRVEACIPIGKNSCGYWLNILQTSSWYQGPCLVEALEKLVAVYQQNSEDLWVVGKAIPTDDQRIFWLQTDRPSRGIFTENTPIYLLSEGMDQEAQELSGIIRMNRRTDHTAILSVELHKGTLPTPSSAVLSSRAMAQYPTVIKIDALFRDALTLDDLRSTEFLMMFFGPHIREGQLFLHSCHALFHGDKTSVGQRVSLEIHTFRKSAVETFMNDPDAGRVLLWRKTHSRSHENLLAVGRIVAFFEYEATHLIQHLMQIDQKQFTPGDGAEHLFLTREFEHIIHDVKRDVEMLRFQDPQHPLKTAPYIQKFSQAFDHLIEAVKALNKQSSPQHEEFWLDVVLRHLGDVKAQVLEAFQDIEKTPAETFALKRTQLENRYTQFKQLINRRTTQPLRNIVDKTVREYEQRSTNPFYAVVPYVHNLLPQQTDYYPVEKFPILYRAGEVAERPQTIEAVLQDGLEELLNNSVRHAQSAHGVRIDIFLDPPFVPNGQTVKVWLQDNGTLTPELFEQIQQSSRGWRDHQERLEQYYITLQISSKIGFGTTCVFEIPVWLSKAFPVHTALKLCTALQELEYEKRKQKGICTDFVGRLLKTLNSSSTPEAAKSHLQKLRTDLEREYTMLHLAERRATHLALFDELVKLIQKQDHYALQEISDVLDQLSQQSLLNMILEIRKEIWKDFQTERVYGQTALMPEDVIQIIPGDLPAYRLSHPASHPLVKDALMWGIKEFMLPEESAYPITATFRLAQERHTILMTLSGKGGMPDQANLLPFRTRLIHLGIENTIEDQALVLFFPIWLRFQ
ncbi:signal transduction histidine kinase [Candidatus Vecturithrix granuli]|uniref:Signal transduction histidine kinase n=1 Tax=Vecturithrix granuli TaxID=1499967 RepID=A0A081C483_VECG1|nr:signal transduction histidine kinase [Candidatus Vecturithrix granuli]